MQTFLAALLVDSLADLAVATNESAMPPDRIVTEWLGDQGARFLSHVVVFFMLIYLWRRHHELYRHISSLNRGTLWLNSAFLACVCLIPFSTALVARSHFTAISLAMLFGTMCLALTLQYALFRHAMLTGSTVDRMGSGVTAIRLFIGVPALIMAAATLVALFLSAKNVDHSAVYGSAVVILLFAVQPIMRAYLSRNPAKQPPEAMKIAQDEKDRVTDRPLSPIASFFAGSSPDRSLLFTDSVYAIAVTIMSAQLLPSDGAVLNGQDVAAQIVDTFQPDFSLGDFWMFAVIFVFIQIMWLQHVRVFLFVGTIGGRTQWLNSLHLFTVVMLPLLFGLLGAAPVWATLPWWLTGFGLTMCVLTLALLTWSALIYKKVRTPAATNAIRVTLTEDVYLLYITAIAIAPLGFIATALPLLIIKDSVINAVWRAPDSSRRSVRSVLFHNPNRGIGTRLTGWAVGLVAAFMIFCVTAVYLRNGIWLFHPQF